MYFDNANSRTRVLDQDLVWGDYAFLAGSSATFEQEFNVYALSYEWAFVRNPSYELAASIGVHYMDMRFQLGQRQLLGSGLRHAALLGDWGHQGQ